ncbi:hypothetical protein [Actinokineospora globicatena]|uniref:hypothetical protein n=1 Tax=Actinokineospora globicatena TaxID=103729 RepID=UPI0020A24729|nr:hypothetical protein [Actinokineospora globicatena]MCP2300861.1 hypothetical protein [Actinokineospora globicatena]GLW77514.1 hypothetical protein Aglo01_19960 [Actinokineospora globicatena]GLW84348.1 hypothetical protein Aglo02_19880 [Actinokineospora globicatena]
MRTCSTTPAELISAAQEDYFFLATPGRWWFTTGCLAQVVVDRDAVHLWTPDGDDVEPWVDPLRQVVDLLHGAAPADWHAFGWAAPELRHAIAGRPDLVGGDQPLLHLVVPRHMADITPSRSVADTVPVAAFRIGATEFAVPDGHHVSTGFASVPSLLGAAADVVLALDSRTELADVIRIG